MTLLSADGTSWRRRGERRSIFGHELFFVDEGPSVGPPLLVLHGFPSSSLDFHRAFPWLVERHRVVIHDHPGFGFSDKPEGAPRADNRPLWSATGRALSARQRPIRIRSWSRPRPPWACGARSESPKDT